MWLWLLLLLERERERERERESEKARERLDSDLLPKFLYIIPITANTLHVVILLDAGNVCFHPKSTRHCVCGAERLLMKSFFPLFGS